MDISSLLVMYPKRMLSFDCPLVHKNTLQLYQYVSLQCQFEDVLAEPEGAHSLICVWKLANFCFTFWKGCTYKCMTLTCGICIASELGCQFAMIAFNHIWSYTPCLKACQINCGFFRKIWRTCLGCYMDPICESCGLVFAAFKK